MLSIIQSRFTINRARPDATPLPLLPITLFWTTLTILVLLTSGSAATECTCRPDLSFDSSLDGGTCTKTQDDSAWCEITWNGGTASSQDTAARSNTPGSAEPLSTHEASLRFLDVLRQNGFEPDPTLVTSGYAPSLVAATALASVDPENYTPIAVQYKAVLMGSSIIQFNPSLIDMALTLYANADDVVGYLSSIDPVEFALGEYKAIASRGCIYLNSDTFEALVKTRFSTYVGDCTNE